MSSKWSNNSSTLTIRWAFRTDLTNLDRLAALDSKHLPAGPLLVADVDGELWAGISVLDSEAFADPFRPTGDLVGLLEKRAEQVRKKQGPMPILRLEPLLARLR
jgi:hypothetical protein